MIISYGHKYGQPDARIKKHFDLRSTTHNTASPEFTDLFRTIVEYGRQHPTEHIGIGCELGTHRSVVMANKVATALRTSVYHRDKHNGPR